MIYSVRVIATSLITDTLSIEAKSEKEALAEVQERIKPELKQRGYEFQLEIVQRQDLARLAA